MQPAMGGLDGSRAGYSCAPSTCSIPGAAPSGQAVTAVLTSPPSIAAGPVFVPKPSPAGMLTPANVLPSPQSMLPTATVVSHPFPMQQAAPSQQPMQHMQSRPFQPFAPAHVVLPGLADARGQRHAPPAMLPGACCGIPQMHRMPSAPSMTVATSTMTPAPMPPRPHPAVLSPAAMLVPASAVTAGVVVQASSGPLPTRRAAERVGAPNVNTTVVGKVAMMLPGTSRPTMLTLVRPDAPVEMVGDGEAALHLPPQPMHPQLMTPQPMHHQQLFQPPMMQPAHPQLLLPAHPQPTRHF